MHIVLLANNRDFVVTTDANDVLPQFCLVRAIFGPMTTIMSFWLMVRIFTYCIGGNDRRVNRFGVLSSNVSYAVAVC